MIKGERRAMGIARLLRCERMVFWRGLCELNKHAAKRAKKLKNRRIRQGTLVEANRKDVLPYI